ncbi:NAD-dependent epimerase/dehydratase family protein [Arcticibacter sp.]|uniref:NAD-dependent epimerase/dehydratase family protein n=1 Tax=Arcticibacter sp. TaxID=1872630 RepID=UPI00388EFD86
MKKKILITGASGFVGSHLVEAAVKEGFDVFAAIRSSSNIKHLESLPVTWVTLSMSDVKKLTDELAEQRYDFIIHCAGSTKAKTEGDYNYVNAELSRNLATAALDSGIALKKFVFVSSLAALGPIAYAEPHSISADHPAAPVTGYGKSKLLAEHYLRKIEGLPLVIVRPTAVYGPREKDIFIILKTINSGLEPYIGRKPQKLSFIYVKDLVKVLLSVLRDEVAPGREYNASDGQVYSKYELAEIMKGITRRRTYKFHIPIPLVSVIASLLELVYSFRTDSPALNKEKINELNAENWACSIKELEQDLGFIADYPLARGLAETINWYKENKWLT